MQKFWVGVAAADHVAIGKAGGFVQVCHGKPAPLRRIASDDGIICYSPTQIFGAADGLQSFTALGFATSAEPYQVEMAAGFKPYRRNVNWLFAKAAPIRPLLELLDLTRGQRNWGYGFRFGLLEISKVDFATIAVAMRAQMPGGVEIQAIST